MGVAPKKTYEQLESELEGMKLIIEKYEDMKIDHDELIKLRTENDIYKNLYGKLEMKNEEEQKNTKEMLIQLASKPTTISNTQNTQNNIFNNLTPLDLSEERIKKALPMYTMPYYLRGPEGMADFLTENLLTDENGNSMYLCNDKNRCYFQYKGLNGARMDDLKCQQLIDSVKPYLEPKILAFKKERDDWIMETYGDSDAAYEFVNGENTIGKKQMENHKLKNKAFDIAKYMVIKQSNFRKSQNKLSVKK